MSPVLGKKTLMELREIVAAHAHECDGNHLSADYDSRLREGERLLGEIDAALSAKRSVRAAKVRRVAKQKTRKEKVAALHELVVRRAQRRCECGGDVVHARGQALHLEHFHGGRNRRAMESLEGCWLLDATCHLQKTKQIPSRAYWLTLFLRHSSRHGYDAEPQRKARADLDSLAIQGRAGGAP